MNGSTTLREARAERLLSIRSLARQASVAPSTIYLTESGRTTPRLSVARRLAAVLGVEPAQIVEFRRTIEAVKARHGPLRALARGGPASRSRVGA